MVIANVHSTDQGAGYVCVMYTQHTTPPSKIGPVVVHRADVTMIGADLEDLDNNSGS